MAIEDKINFESLSLGELDRLADKAASEQKKGAEAVAAMGRMEGQGSIMDEFTKEQAEIRRKAENEILDRLVAVHEDRSPHAQALDEAFQAEKTQDPVEWKSAPNEFDFPFIDDPMTL